MLLGSGTVFGPRAAISGTPPQGPHRLVVRTSRCGRDNPGSTPGVDIFRANALLRCNLSSWTLPLPTRLPASRLLGPATRSSSCAMLSGCSVALLELFPGVLACCSALSAAGLLLRSLAAFLVLSAQLLAGLLAAISCSLCSLRSCSLPLGVTNGFPCALGCDRLLILPWKTQHRLLGLVA